MVAIPIPSGEGQNNLFCIPMNQERFRSQYLYLLVKVRTMLGSARTTPSWWSQYLYLLVKVRTRFAYATCSMKVVAIPIPSGEGQNPKRLRTKTFYFKKSQYLYLLVKVRTTKLCTYETFVHEKSRNTYTFW